MARRSRPPISIILDQLETKGQSGCAPNGTRWVIKGAPLGAHVTLQPQKKNKGRLISIDRLPEDHCEAPCAIFGICGGCQLQQMPYPKQVQAKSQLVKRLFPDIHPIQDTVPSPIEYGYRNKIELTYGTKEYTPQPVAQQQLGSYLGFHPRGWFSKIVSVHSCAIAASRMQPIIAKLQNLKLNPAWDERAHQGVWRHVIIREGETLLVSLVTSSELTEIEFDRVAQTLLEIKDVSCVNWIETDRLSKVAQGTLKKSFGQPVMSVHIRQKKLTFPYDAFFQVNTPGLERLLDCIIQACGQETTLIDLYCGVGSIGIALSDHFSSIIGIELHEKSIVWAKKNARANGVNGEWYAGSVETILPTLSLPRDAVLLVDPPRDGLHPKAAKFIAQQQHSRLIYVACAPRALVRDRAILEAGGWCLSKIWSVDLFPQTPHVEIVALFTKDS